MSSPSCDSDSNGQWVVGHFEFFFLYGSRFLAVGAACFLLMAVIGLRLAAEKGFARWMDHRHWPATDICATGLEDYANINQARLSYGHTPQLV